MRGFGAGTFSVPWQDASREDVLMPVLLGVFTAALVVILQTMELEPGPLSVAAMFGLPALILYTFLARPVRFGLGLAAVLLASVLYNGINGAPALRMW